MSRGQRELRRVVSVFVFVGAEVAVGGVPAACPRGSNRPRAGGTWLTVVHGSGELGKGVGRAERRARQPIAITLPDWNPTLLGWTVD